MTLRNLEVDLSPNRQIYNTLGTTALKTSPADYTFLQSTGIMFASPNPLHMESYYDLMVVSHRISLYRHDSVELNQSSTAILVVLGCL
jgi:hypothetical protein